MSYNTLRYSFRLVKSIRIMSSLNVNTFKLTNYDVVGFDFDNTLVIYNLTNLFQEHYNFLTTNLIEKRGYIGLSTQMNQNDIDFIRRGLFMDFKKGNILNISDNGTILQASHGTKKLTKEELINIYGGEMKWKPTNLFIENKLIIKEGLITNETYCFFDFTDSIAVLVYAKLVDLVDKRQDFISDEYKTIWNDLLQTIIDMYNKDSTFFKNVSVNLSNYVYKCDKLVLDWLKNLSENCKLILITSATSRSLQVLAKYALGDGWENLFHTIIESANKPDFFLSTNVFKDKSGKEIILNTSCGYYLNGNWADLYKVFTEEIGRPIKSVYIGDSFIQDIYAPTMITCCPTMDSLAIVEELLADGHFPGTHPHKDYIHSNYWDTYFLKDGKITVIADIIKKHTKLCLPQISYLAEKPIDYEHTPFWIKSKQ